MKIGIVVSTESVPIHYNHIAVFKASILRKSNVNIRSTNFEVVASTSVLTCFNFKRQSTLGFSITDISNVLLYRRI